MGVGSAVDDRAAVRRAAQDLAPDLSARASEAEKLRTMPDDLVARVRAAGLFRMVLPARLGGLELDARTIIEVVETLSAADGSAGWTILIGNSTAFFAWLDPAVAQEMIGDDVGFCSTSMFAPLGRAETAGDDAFTVSGRWPFNSGCPHSEWLQVGVFVVSDDVLQMRDGGTDPDWRFAFVRSESALIEDTWDALGLRGTGSHHLRLNGVRVPVEHFAAPVYESARGDGPLSFLGVFDVASIMMSGFPLGVARHAVDEFTALARSKFRGNPANTVAGNDHAQMLLSQAESRLRSARLYVLDVAGAVWDTCCRGEGPSSLQRSELSLACCHAMRTALEVVDSLYRLAGAEVVFTGHPLERCFRDLHAASQHIIYSATQEQQFARNRLGLDPDFARRGSPAAAPSA